MRKASAPPPIPIDDDIHRLSTKLAHEAWDFVRDAGDHPTLQSISQWASLEYALAAPVQRLRNYARKQAEYNRRQNEP